MFSLSLSDLEKVAEWQKELHPDGAPYSGVNGSNLTYSFTPTSLGVIVKVKDAYHKDKELNLTNYDDW